MNFLLIFSCVLLATNGITAELPTNALKKCLDHDSISCIQMMIFRQAKSFFDTPSIDIFGGLSLKKTEETRQGKSIEDNTIAVESAKSVEERNSEIENYFMTNAKNFFKERSLSINFADTARSIAKKIPENIKSDLIDLFSEGRAKRRKIMAKLQLIAYGVLAKFGVLIMAGLFGLLLVAKHALTTSVLALGLALFIGLAGVVQRSGGLGKGGGLLSGFGLGNLFGGGSNSIGGYSAGGGGGGWAQPGGWNSGAGSAGWSSYGGGGGWGGGWDSHGSYSSPVAQTIAYSGHKQAR